MATDPLITKRELANWARRDPDVVEDDLFADEVIEAFSSLVRQYGNDDWTAETLPVRAKWILKVNAAYVYTNPDQFVSESIAGGPSERRAEHAVRGLALSDEEIQVLADLAGKPDPESTSGRLFILPLGRGAPLQSEVTFAPDDSGSDWMIPWLSSVDPGGSDAP